MNSTELTIENAGTAAQFEKESHLRSLLKGISWRIIGTADTMLWTWFFTHSLKIAASVGAFEVGSKIILYYFHERLWQIIPRGSVRNWLKKNKEAQEADGLLQKK
jgi:uncharacterized membrane protein